MRAKRAPSRDVDVDVAIHRRSSILDSGKVRLFPAPAIIDFFMILGRTDLRMGASKAKFDSGNDFEVGSAVATRKPRETFDSAMQQSR